MNNNVLEDHDICPICKNDIQKDAKACNACGAHEITEYTSLGKILLKLKKANILVLIFVLLILFKAFNKNEIYTSYATFFGWGMFFFIPQLLLWFLPKNKLIKKVWVKN